MTFVGSVDCGIVDPWVFRPRSFVGGSKELGDGGVGDGMGEGEIERLLFHQLIADIEEGKDDGIVRGHQDTLSIVKLVRQPST